MNRILLPALMLLGTTSGAWAQSLLQDGASPYDPPKKPALRKHDHVQIEFVEKAKAPEAERRARWDKELRQWTRFDGKESAAPIIVTAEVIDVRPNGTLVLLAIKRTGEVAAASVTLNKAAAEHLANLSVVIETAKP